MTEKSGGLIVSMGKRPMKDVICTSVFAARQALLFLYTLFVIVKDLYTGYLQAREEQERLKIYDVRKVL